MSREAVEQTELKAVKNAIQNREVRASQEKLSTEAIGTHRAASAT